MSLEIQEGGASPALEQKVDALQASIDGVATDAQAATQAANEAATAAAAQANAAAGVVSSAAALLEASNAAVEAAAAAAALEPVLEQYRDEAAAATPDPLIPLVQLPDGSWAILDADGEIQAVFAPDGFTVDVLNVSGSINLTPAQQLAAGSPVMVPVLSVPGFGDLAEAVCDAEGNILSFVTLDGIHGSLRDGALVFDQERPQAPDIDYVIDEATSLSVLASAKDGKTMFLLTGDGQSWQVGQHVSSVDGDSVTIVPEFPGYARMPVSGVRPAGGSVADWIDLKEDTTTIYENETPASGMASAFIRTVQAAHGFTPMVLVGVSANGGTAYEVNEPGGGTIQGSAQERELKRIVRGAVAYAKSQGCRLVWLFHFRAQGEANHASGTSARRYQFGQHQSAARFNAWGKALTGQVEDVLFLQYQTNWSSLTAGRANPINAAQLECSRVEPARMVCIGPVYDIDHSDKGHATPKSYRANVGCRAGYFGARVALGPGEEPLQVVNAWRQSPTVVILEYSKPIAIEADDSKVNVSALGPGKGVEFYDGDPGADVKSTTVQSIEIVPGKPTWLKVTLAAPDTGPNPRLLIAQRGTPFPGGGYCVGRTYGARAGIRSADPFYVDALTGRTLYHWACAEAVPLPRS